jgi:hypothetical protein
MLFRLETSVAAGILFLAGNSLAFASQTLPHNVLSAGAHSASHAAASAHVTKVSGDLHSKNVARHSISGDVAQKKLITHVSAKNDRAHKMKPSLAVAKS